jgi:ribosomal protein L27
MSKSQRHTRSGAGRRASQADEAAIYAKLTGLCQYERVSGNLKKRKQRGTV